MMRSMSEPAEYVMWGAASLLAVILGIGTAFVCWAGLHRADNALLAEAAITLLCAGLAVLGLAAEQPIHRVFCVIFAIALLVAYLLGGTAFGHLTL
jgi:hypothetical protein